MLDFLTDAELKQLRIDYPEYSPDDCPTCHNEGSYRYQGKQWPCDCAIQKHLFTHYLHAGIGLTFQRLTWADLKVPERQLVPVHNYVENSTALINRGMGLLLDGPVGTGKTMISNLVLKDLVKKGVSCYATTFSQTVESFTAGWSSLEDKNRFAKRFMKTKVLLLDDLGKEFRRSNQLQQTTFDHILRTRIQNARPTILNTNMNSAELHSGYGAAVLSLLVEASISVPLLGDDFRETALRRTLAEVAAGETRPIT